MTQYRDEPDRVSNQFDKWLKGIGKRGSSFTDVDALTHDEHDDRFLFQEFKGPNGTLSVGQSKTLKGLTRKEYVTVWCVRIRHDGQLDWCDVASRVADVIDVTEYQARFRRWWNREPIIIARPAATISAPHLDVTSDTSAMLHANDIQW